MENLKHAFLVPEPEASISEEHSEFEREHPDTLEAAEMPLAHAKMRHEQTTTEGNACETRTGGYATKDADSREAQKLAANAFTTGPGGEIRIQDNERVEVGGGYDDLSSVSKKIDFTEPRSYMQDEA